MRIFLKHLASLLILISFSETLFAAEDYPKKINFRNIMQNQDIALGEVEALLQDHDGFMWLGGRNGFLRYDGYDFLSIPLVADLKDLSQTLPINQVIDLLEDSHQNMWVATRSGLLQYHRGFEILLRLNQSNGEDLQIYRDTVTSVAEAPNGEILAGAFAGLNVINPQTLNAVIITHDPTDPKSLPNNNIHKIFVDAKGLVWLGTDAGLVSIDWATKEMHHYLPDPNHPQSIPDNAIWAIAEDLQGNLWIGVHNGLYRFHPKQQTFKRYQHDPNDRFSLAGNITRDIFVDSSGWVWTGSDRGGISLYDANNDRFIRYQSEAGRSGSLSANSIRRIIQDNSGDMWIGTYPSGANFHDRSSAAITVYKHEDDLSRGLLGDDTAALVEDSDGNLWIGGDDVTRYDPKNETFTHYQHIPDSDQSRIDTASIISGLIDSDGDIWFGSWAGSFNRYNRQTDRFEQMPFDPTLARRGIKTTTQLNDSVVWHLYEDKRNNIWVATHNSGLSKYDKKANTYTVYEQTPDDTTALSNNLVWTMFEDSKGRFWVGTASGLNLMDREKGTFKHYMPDDNDRNSLVNNSILSIFEDSQGRVWFGTDGGLHLYHPDNDNFSMYNTKDGFVDSGIRSITEDRSGNLWLGTNNGIVMFNPDSNQVRNFMRYNGEKIGGMSTGAALTTRNGEIVFGGKNGMYIINTTKLGVNSKIPPLAFTDFRIFTKKVPFNSPENILTKVVNETEKLTLDYTKSMISFSFAALNYRDSDKNQYAYKLDGFDDKWREVGNQRTALYTNLNAGRYTFRIKGSNNDGLWNEKGREITIIQLPPPWQTWWAYTLYTLALIGIMIKFIHSQKQKRRMVEEQNRLLEIKVSERTAELREKNSDIQAMLSNMRQGLFTIEANGCIHPEYSRYLEEIFETQSIAGNNALTLLFSQADLGSDTFDQIKESIFSIIGEDEMNYEFNSHLLLQEYEAVISDNVKYLSLDWNPIVIDDTVAKLMVSVRDVTQLKQMEIEARSKKRELDMISQLLNVPAKKYLAFVESSQRFISQNRAELDAHEQRSDDVIELLFRNMHTIKGNCRTYNFSYFSDVVHEVESVYSLLKSQADMPWNRQDLLEDLGRVDGVLAEYEKIYYSVLGRESTVSARDQNGFWADSTAIATIRSCIDEAKREAPNMLQKTFQPVQQLLDRALSSSLSDILADIISSLPSIAIQLRKEEPTVSIEDNHIRIKAEFHELMTNVFAHILRNCVDHGIETPDIRSVKGKKPSGTIHIRCQTEKNHLAIHIQDDGQGINIEKLLSKGIELGRWNAEEKPTDDKIAELIFNSGVSTKEHVSDVSGRGVGMNAVKQFLTQQGGDIQLRLTPQTSSATEPCKTRPFELIIQLPPSVFTVMA